MTTYDGSGPWLYVARRPPRKGQFYMGETGHFIFQAAFDIPAARDIVVR